MPYIAGMTLLWAGPLSNAALLFREKSTCKNASEKGLPPNQMSKLGNEGGNQKSGGEIPEFLFRRENTEASSSLFRPFGFSTHYYTTLALFISIIPRHESFVFWYDFPGHLLSH